MNVDGLDRKTCSLLEWSSSTTPSSHQSCSQWMLSSVVGPSPLPHWFSFPWSGTFYSLSEVGAAVNSRFLFSLFPSSIWWNFGGQLGFKGCVPRKWISILFAKLTVGLGFGGAVSSRYVLLWPQLNCFARVYLDLLGFWGNLSQFAQNQEWRGHGFWSRWC